jgi:hypothetical protein
MKTERKPLDYGIGALAVVVVSIGVAAIVYSLGLIPLDIINILAWIFGPLGAYTVIYSFVGGKESTYYLVWGAVMVAIGIVSGFYNQVSVFLVFGILIIVLAVIGIIGYWRSRK